MYRTHWGLRESPFRGGSSPRFFYQSPTHEEALARLHFLADEHRRLGLLLGDHGSGESTVIDIFARRLRRSGYQVANITVLGIEAHELLWLVAAELGAAPGRNDDVFQLGRSISDRLAENRYQQLDTVILLDDADEATPDALHQIARLAQADSTVNSRLTIVLAATAEGVGRLGNRLLELAELRIDLDPWEEADTVNYLNRSLAQAGCTGAAFDAAAMTRLHELCGGVPRRINQLANLALLAGAGRQLPQVDAETIEAVHQELATVAAQ